MAQVDAEVLAAKTAMKAKEDIMESVIVLEGAQIALTETPALEIKSDPIEITTRRNLVTPTQGQIGAETKTRENHSTITGRRNNRGNRSRGRNRR